MANLTTQEKVELIKSIAKNGGEIVGEEELAKILESGEKLYTYDGFEPSGQMHIAQGIIRAINTNKMIEAGFTFRMWVADWFGYINNKMGGDLDKIKTVGNYFIEIWRASGMDLDNVEFLWTSDYTGDTNYWATVMKVAKALTLNRAIKTTEIMGRSESDNLSAAQIIYPCMQIADIFYVMKCQVTQLGLDQRKANVIAREVGSELGFWKPVIVSHGMLQGLGTPSPDFQEQTYVLSKNRSKMIQKETLGDVTVEAILKDNEIEVKIIGFEGGTGKLGLEVGSNLSINNHLVTVMDNKDEIILLKFKVKVSPQTKLISRKMSKSKPDTAIFMTDSKEDIQRKITKAYAPEGVVEDNPILDYCKQIIFEAKWLKRETPLLTNGMFEVKRPEKFGGDVSYGSYEELEKDYAEKKLFPLDLKNAVIEYLDQLIAPVRSHFETDSKAKALLEEVRSYQVTR